MNDFEAAILTLLDNELLVEQAKPLSDEFFDRIIALKQKAASSKLLSLPFDVSLGYDIPLTWYEIQQANLDGWRLPDIDELGQIYNTVGDLYNKRYWSSIEHHSPLAWVYDFETGLIDFFGKSSKNNVILIKDKTNKELVNE